MAGLHLLIPPGLPLGGRRQRLQLIQRADPPGNVPQDIVLHLLPQFCRGVRQGVQIIRGKHQASPGGRLPKVSVSVPAAAWAAICAASSSL